MCAAKDEVAELSNLHLSSPMDFYYTSQGKQNSYRYVVLLKPVTFEKIEWYQT